MEKQELIKRLVTEQVEEGTMNTSSLSYARYFDEFEENEQFVRDNIQDYINELESREEVAEVEYNDESIDVIYWGAYCPNADDYFATRYYAKIISKIKDESKLKNIIEYLLGYLEGCLDWDEQCDLQELLEEILIGE